MLWGLWLAALPAAALLVSFTLDAWRHGLEASLARSDYRAFYTAGLMLAAGVRGDLYDLETQFRWQSSFLSQLRSPAGLMPFLNPPPAALPQVPLARLPFELAYLLQTVAQLLLLAGLLLALRRAVAEGGGRPGMLTWGVAAFLPLWVTALQGQLSLLLALGFVQAWRRLQAGRDLAAGAWLGTLFLKPQTLPLVLLLLAARRRWQALAGVAASGAALLALSLALVGLDGWRRYLGLLSQVPSWQDELTVFPGRMLSWRGLLYTVLGDAPLVPALWLAGALAAGACLLYVWGADGSPAASWGLRWATLPLAMVLASPHVNLHDLALVAPSLALLLADGVLGRGQVGHHGRLWAVGMMLVVNYGLYLGHPRYTLLAVPALAGALLWLAATARSEARRSRRELPAPHSTGSISP